MLTKAIGGLFSAIGIAHIVKPDFVWSSGFYPAGTPAGHAMWIFTVQAFGGFITALGMGMIGFQSLGLIAGGTAITTISSKTVGPTSPPTIVGLLMVSAGIASLCDDDRPKRE